MNISSKGLNFSVRLFGFATAVDLCRRINLLKDFYDTNSILNPAQTSLVLPYQAIPIEICFGIHLLITSLLLLSKYHVLFLVLNLVMNYSLTLRCFYGDLAGNHIFFIAHCLLICIFLEKKIHKERADHSLFLEIFIWQIIFIYLFSFVHKLASDNWFVNLNSLKNGLDHPFYSTSIGVWLSGFRIPVIVAHYCVLFSQIASSLLLTFYLVKKKILYRSFALAILVSFHVISFLLLKLTSFPLICICVLSVVYFSFSSDVIFHKKPFWYYLILVLIFSSNVISLFNNRPNIPYPFQQRWGMMTNSYALKKFTPFVVERGSEIDLLTGSKISKSLNTNIVDIDPRFDYPEWKSFFMRARRNIIFQVRLLNWVCVTRDKHTLLDLYVIEDNQRKLLHSVDCDLNKPAKK